jgi:preprotein translocase subunit SecD
MKTITTKFASLCLLAVFFASACSHSPKKPQFTITPADLAAPAVLSTNNSPSGEHATIVLHLQFTPAKADSFQTFTRKHKGEQTQLLVGSKVVAEPTVAAEISGGRFNLAFSDLDEARAVRDLLSKK